MPRSVQITVPPDRADSLIQEVKKLDGLIGLRVQRGISIQPPGDVVSVEITTPGLHKLVRIMDQFGVGIEPSSSALTSHPLSFVTASQADAVATDPTDATWEEIDFTIGKESNMTVNGLLLMACSGILAAIGISTDTLHLVIGAMVIAPGFEPITRIAVGLVAGGRGWRHGLLDTVKGYLVLAAAAGFTAIILRQLGTPPLGGSETYLPAGVLVSYWTTISSTGLLATTVASIAGGLLLVSHRSVLTAGVMIALALVPAAAISSMALVTGAFDQCGSALLRWVIEVTSVFTFSALVFLWKRRSLLQRSTHAG